MRAAAECQPDLCCVCLDELCIPGLACQKLPCGHSLHEKCVLEMRRLGSSASCPICRAEIDELTPVSRLVEDGILLYMRDRYEDCFQKVTEAFDIDHTCVPASYMMGLLLYNGRGVPKYLPGAAKHYEFALRQGMDVQNDLGVIYRDLCRNDEAVELFKAGDDFNSIFNLAVSCLNAGTVDQGEILFRQASLMGHAQATYNLGNILSRQGQTEEAEHYYLNLINNESWFAMKNQNVAECHGEGMSMFVGLAMNNLARNYELSGRHKDAMAFWIQASSRQNVHAILAIKGRSELFSKLAAVTPTLAPLINDVLRKPSPTMTIVGLTSTGKELNGAHCKVLYFKKASGRFAVDVVGKGKKLLNIQHLRSHEDADSQGGSKNTGDSSLSCQSEHQDAHLMEAILKSKEVPSSIQLIVLEYSRNPEWFRHALLVAPELQACRRTLADAGYNFELPSGAKCFVSVAEFEACMASSEVKELDKRHVVVSKDLEDKLKQVVENGRKATPRCKRGSFTVTDRSEFEVPSRSNANEFLAPFVSTPVELIKRTFIHIPVPSSMRSVSSARPSTA